MLQQVIPEKSSQWSDDFILKNAIKLFGLLPVVSDLIPESIETLTRLDHQLDKPLLPCLDNPVDAFMHRALNEHAFQQESTPYCRHTGRQWLM